MKTLSQYDGKQNAVFLPESKLECINFGNYVHSCSTYAVPSNELTAMPFQHCLFLSGCASMKLVSKRVL